MAAELNSLTAYHEELKKPGIVVFDFYSPSCGPCKVVAPLFNNLASDVSNAQVNGLDDEGSKVQEAARVTWWPTFVVYNDGQEKWRAKVPNPPEQHPISGLATALATGCTWNPDLTSGLLFVRKGTALGPNWDQTGNFRQGGSGKE